MADNRLTMSLLLIAPAWCQTPADTAWEQRIASHAAAPRFSCRFAQLHPALDFGPLSETGYQVTFSYEEFSGTGHAFEVYLRVTSKAARSGSRYFHQRFPLPAVPATQAEGRLGGEFVSTAGDYAAEAIAIDDRNRVCRGDWQIRVPVELRAPVAPPTMERVAIYVDAAPLTYLTGLQPVDVLTLSNAIASLVAELPAKTVRLVVFNLIGEVEIFRSQDFQSRDLEAVTDRLHALQLGTVGVDALAAHTGSASYLAALVHRELQEPQPAKAIIFLGPLSRARVPTAKGLFDWPGLWPRFFYIQYRAPSLSNGGAAGQGIDNNASMGAGSGYPAMPRPPATVRDTIANAMGRLHGETEIVTDRKSFMKAIGRIAQKSRRADGEP